MCGIVGVLNRASQTPPDRATVRHMRDSLAYRGPDEASEYAQGPLALGHRRLAVIDLATGSQPMTTPNGRYTIVFNGEIYNYRQLRANLESKYEFQTQSDTEVLLYHLAEHGPDGLNQLNGMFAFALWDSHEDRLFLARDRFGKKPLFYADIKDMFAFASEPKSLFRHPSISAAIDEAQVTKYLLFEYVPSPATGFKTIRQLPMGHYAEVTQSSLQIKEWWKPRFLPKKSLSEKEVLTKLDALLGAAVERRMIADVPVGVLLSGGLDSTTIAWYMTRVSGNVHSFSVSFADKSYNEEVYAAQAAKAVGTQHHVVPFTVADFFQALEATSEYMDIPFADASLLPTYILSREARRHITVALDGDGSDELFGGYGTFLAADVSERLPTLNPDSWRALGRLVAHLPTHYDYFSTDFKLKSFVRGLGYPLALRHQVWLGAFTDAELEGLLTPKWRTHIANLFADIESLEHETVGLKTRDVISQLLLHHYLPNGILTKLDRATMFTSLEARTPFLDVELAEFATRLPVTFKQNKAILKKLMRGRIPDSIIDRPKQGFALPLGPWLRTHLFDWAQGVLSDERIAAVGIFDPRAVRQLLHQHRQGRTDNRKKLWTLLMFQLWYERWIDSSDSVDFQHQDSEQKSNWPRAEKIDL